MDTDSLYFAISRDDIDSVIKPKYKEEYNKKVYRSCNDQPLKYNQYNWFPR